MDNAWCLLTVVVQPQEAAKHHTAAFSPSPLLAHSGMWEKIGEVKFVGWNSLIGKARLCAQAKLIKTFIQSFPLAGRFPLASCFQESRVSTFMTFIWEDKCHNSECPAPSCFLMPSWGYLIQLQYNIIAMGYSFGYFGSCILAVSPPNLFFIPNLLDGGAMWEKKHPWFCVSTPQQQQKHQCVINTVWVTNPTYELLWRKWNLYERKPAHSCKFLEPFGKKCLQLHHLTHMRFLAGYVP